MTYICKVSKLYPRKAAGGALCFRYKKPDGCWAEKSTGTKKRDESQLFVREFQQRLEEGAMPTDFADLTVAEATRQYVSERKPPVLAEKTYKNECYYRDQLVRRMGKKRLCQITHADFVAYRNDRLQGKSASPVKARPVNLELHILRSVLKRANLWNRIAPHYQALPEPRSDLGRALTHEELRRLEATAEADSRWQEVYWAEVLAANTGMRGGEIKKLRLRVIDVEKAELRILRATTKNDSGRRYIPLNPKALWAAAHLIERAHLLGANESEHYLFPEDMSRHTKIHDPLRGKSGYDPSRHQKSWDKAWRSLRKTAGFPGLRFHDLRHTFITHMAEAGVPIQVVEAMVGHMSAEMLRYYTHISTQASRQAVEKLQHQRQEFEIRDAVASVQIN
jgi:integrase